MKIYQEIAFEKNFNAYLSRVLSIESCSKFEAIRNVSGRITCSSFFVSR